MAHTNKTQCDQHQITIDYEGAARSRCKNSFPMQTIPLWVIGGAGAVGKPDIGAFLLIFKKKLKKGDETY
jgi:hypothetical protein